VSSRDGSLWVRPPSEEMQEAELAKRRVQCQANHGCDADGHVVQCTLKDEHI
jgi:hypothetical protein